MFEQYERIKDGEDEDLKAALVEQICASLRIHTQIEEEVFYPAFRSETDENDMTDEAIVEHEGAKRLIDDLEGMEPDDDLYDAKVKVLSEYIRHHVREEESEMFKRAAASSLDMAELGREMASLRQDLEEEYGLVDEDAETEQA